MANNSSNGGEGVLIMLALVGGLIILTLGFCWNILVTIVYFTTRWVPPVLACGAFLLLPSVQVWFVCCLSGFHGVGRWTETEESIRSAWRGHWVGWLIPPCTILAVLLWNLVLPGDSSWLAACKLPLCFQDLFRWNQVAIQGWYARPFHWPLVLLMIPSVLVALAWFRVVEGVLVWRIRKIHALVLGADMHTERLSVVDKDISAGFRHFGSARQGRHTAAFRAWVASSIGVILRDTGAAGKQCDAQYRLATAEWTAMKVSIARYEVARNAYRKGLARLRRLSSMALLGSLEDAGRILVSPGLRQQVEAQQWDAVNELMDEVAAELGRIDGLADEWAQTATGTLSGSDAGTITCESALELLGLAKTFSPAQVHERRKQFAQIYHPDRASEDKQRERNASRFTRVNVACDLLLDKARCGR